MFVLILADLIVLLHFVFILFVVTGGLLVLKWPRLIWIHIPAVVWGVIVEWCGLICPLTPLENQFRLQAGQEGYSGDFIAQYLMPIIYPESLNADLQLVLAGVVIVLNSVVYVFVLRRRRGSR